MTTRPPERRLHPRDALTAALVVVGVVIGLWLIYLLRQPIGWVAISVFLAVALSAPVNKLAKRMKRGFAILIVYVGLLLVPIGVLAMIVPPLVNQVNSLIQNLPAYVQDLQEFAQKNPTLARLERDYDITGTLTAQAERLPARIGDAAGVLSGFGLGLLNSVFQVVTILVLTAFLLGSGRRWVVAALALMPAGRATRVGSVADRIAAAVGGYVGGMLLQATVAALTSLIVLTVLGVPFAGALAVIIFFLDLIPLIGASIGGFIVGIVTIFSDFPIDTIVWLVWFTIYQQLENNLIQPQIQKRAVNVHPFVVLVAVLFGSSLLGVLGALVAIPAAASLQIAIAEWWAWRHTDSPAIVLPDGTPAPGVQRSDDEAARGELVLPPGSSPTNPSGDAA